MKHATKSWLQDDATLHEQAASLALSYPGAASAELPEQARHFIERSAHHRQAYEDAARALFLVDEAANSPEMAAVRAESLRARPPRVRAAPALWIAASLCLVLAGGTAGVLFTPLLTGGQTSSAPVASSEIVYRTAVGERRTIMLPDGSQAVLDTSSTLRVRYTAQARAVELLSGQALFTVAKHQPQPFQVYVGDQRITATGTVFDVLLEGGRMRVALLAGSVRVEEVRTEKASAPEVVLAPGQGFEQSEGLAHVTQIDPKRVQSWVEGVLDFDDDTLAAAAAELNRYSRRQLVVEGQEARALRVSGTFAAADIDRFAQTMTELFPLLKHSDADNRIILSMGRHK